MSAIAVGQYKSAKEMQTFSTLGVVISQLYEVRYRDSVSSNE